MDIDGVCAGLNALVSQPDTKAARSSIETLKLVFQNARGDDEKHRVLSLCKERVQNDLWRHQGARSVLLNGGWVHVQPRNEIRFVAGPEVADVVLEMLVKYRDIKPHAREWTPGNKIIDNSKAELERQKKAEAIKERDKEYEACMKDKRERHELAERIKAEHRADMMRRRSTNNSFHS